MNRENLDKKQEEMRLRWAAKKKRIPVTKQEEKKVETYLTLRFGDKKRRRAINQKKGTVDYFYEHQQGRCAICKKPVARPGSVKGKRGPALDHCHTTNRVRGLLCMKCNVFIGLAQEDITILKSAIKYLKKASI
jgi:hypothetical protein